MMRILYIKVELNSKTIRVLDLSILKIRSKFKQVVRDMRVNKLLKNKLRKTLRKLLAFDKIAIIEVLHI